MKTQATEQEVAVMNNNAETANSESAIRRMTVVPRGELFELDNGYELMLDLPGVTTNRLEVTAENRELTVRGIREIRNREIEMEYVRRFELGDGIDSERIAAKLRDGVLTVSLPKSRMAVARSIPIEG